MKTNKIILSDTTQVLIQDLANASNQLEQAMIKINDLITSKEFETLSNLLDLTNFKDDINFIETNISDLNRNKEYTDLANSTQDLYNELNDISFTVETNEDNE